VNAAAQRRWRRTNAPMASSRTDDVWFFDADHGWAVNSDGHVLQTLDGGDSWQRRFAAPPGVYLRCVAFATDELGWVGTLDERNRLFQTRDGGATWVLVDNLPGPVPPAICGLSVVGERVVYGSGTNIPRHPAGVIKSIDGGATWTAIDMGAHATLLVDVFFRDERHGWVVGGRAGEPDPLTRDDVQAVVLETEDGGATWHNRLAGLEGELPRGEWGWKIHFVDELVGFVSLENFTDGAILKTVDGGRSWTRKPVTDPQDNANLEGVGFVDGQLGWAGGWGDKDFTGGFTSETRDGGETWSDANHVGKFLNRFRFIREPELVGYAAGDSVYKYSAAPVAPGLARAPAEPEAFVRARLPLEIRVSSEAGGEPARVDVWDRFGDHLATPLEVTALEPGTHRVSWAGETESGDSAGPGLYIYRVTLGDSAESRTVLVEG
jgi:photosystem II stability/assembly factor-like uncharacterized protein